MVAPVRVQNTKPRDRKAFLFLFLILPLSLSEITAINAPATSTNY